MGNNFGSAQFGSIEASEAAASGTMIPDDEGAEHLLPMGASSFSTGSRFGAGAAGSSAVSISDEPAHKMIRRKEPVYAQTRVQWKNDFGSSKADVDEWSFQSFT